MKVSKVSFPQSSVLASSKSDYCDSFQGLYSDGLNKISSSDIGKAFFRSSPDWASTLFEIRNRIVSIFGLKVSKAKNRQELLDNFKCEAGERLGLFKIYQTTEDEIILGEDDRHLDFRVSLLKEDGAATGEKKLTISTTVKFNNWFGKLYFLPVKPFHKLIVPRMLKRTITEAIKTA